MTPYGSLRDPVAAEQFARLGWVALPLFGDAAHPSLARLAQLLGDHPGAGAPFFSGVHSDDLEYRARVDQAVRSELAPVLEDHLVGHRIIVGFGLIKEPDARSDLPPHQDWCVVDEAHTWSANLWCPVTHVGADDGRLSVLPGSHRLPPTLRGSPGSPTWLDELSQQSVRELGIELDVPLGHAVLVDNRLVHWSAPNRGHHRRLVASANIVPLDAPILHWYFEESTASCFEVGDDFFLRCRIGDRPEGRLVTSIPTPRPPPVTTEDLVHLARVAGDG